MGFNPVCASAPFSVLSFSLGLPIGIGAVIFQGGTRAAKEVAYVTAGRLIQQYQDFCRSKGINFTRIESVRPHDETTLFCSAGMQQYKSLFSDPSYIGTVANSQACLRMGDLEEIGDGTHFLHFTMLGLFSFREMTVSSHRRKVAIPEVDCRALLSRTAMATR